MRRVVSNIFDAMGISYEPFAVIDDGTVIEDYYDEGYLLGFIGGCKKIISTRIQKGKQFFNTEQKYYHEYDG